MIYGEEIIEEVRSRNDIVDLISTYVPLKKKGSSYFGLCPFHNEKSPSFSVSRDKQMYYCFGCGAGGNVFTFLMEYENFSFPEALKYLAERAGMELPEEELNEEAKRAMDEKARLREMNKLSANYFYYLLHSKRGQKGLAYLKDRGITDATIKHFGLGYADIYNDDLYRFLKSKGYSDEDLKDSALVTIDERRGGSDKFWNRVMFPIMDVNNRVIGFGGRVMGDGSPKYLNSKETKLFDKSRNLYGLNFARSSRKKEIILCEGYMDVISMHQAGFTNAVAALGTAFTSGHGTLLNRYTENVILSFDSDEAGQRAILRAIPILKEAGLTVRVLDLTPYKDPDEFIKSKGNDGPAAFKALLDKCGNDVEYRLQKLKNAHNIQLTEGKVAFLEEAAKLIATISSPIERDVYSSKVASELGVDKNAFKQQVSRVSRRGERSEEKKQARQIQLELSRRNDKINPEHFQKPRSSSAEEALLVYLLNNPDAYEEISARVKPEQFQNTLMRRFFEYFSARIERGEDPLTNTAADFTQDENSKLYQLMSQAIPGASTAEAMNEYINVINEESSKLNSGDLADVSNEELMAYLDKIRKKKQ